MTTGQHTISQATRPPWKRWSGWDWSNLRLQEFTRHCERVTKLFVYDIVETGVTQRLAGAVVRDIGRLKQDEPERYECIKEAAWNEARQMLARTRIDQVLRDVGVYASTDLPTTG